MRFKSVLFVSLLAFAPLAVNAQVFDPLSRGNGGVVTGLVDWQTAGSQPTVSGTGTPTLFPGSSNIKGVATAGASATSVVITFGGGGFVSAIPFCNVDTQTQLAAFAYSVSKTAITITQTATSGNLIDYHCDPAILP